MKDLYRKILKIFIISIFGLFYSFQLMAESYKFDYFGYSKETIISGPKSGSTFFFKQRKDLEHRGSLIHLELVFSKELNKQQSKVLFFVNDLPIGSSSFSQVGDTLKVDIPVRSEDFESGYLKFEIKSDLFKDDVECRDFSDPEYWVKITDNSRLETKLISQFSTKEVSKTLSELIPDIEMLVIPRNLDLNLSQFASYIHFFYRDRFGVSLPISYLDEIVLDSLDRAMVIGLSDLLSEKIGQKLKVSKGQGKLKVLNNTVTDSLINIKYYTSNILLTSQDYDGIKKVIQYIFDADLTKSTLSDHLIVKNASVSNLDFNYQLNTEYQLSELGLEEEMVSGSCRIIKNIQLPRFLAKNDLNLISFHLKVNHKPVESDEQGYINIYLNNSLLQTYGMDETGVVDKIIQTKGKPIKAGSYFSIEYIYLPGGKCCGENNADFFAQIDPVESVIKVDLGKDSAPIFSAFPKNFSGGEIQLISDLNFTKNEIPALSKLIGEINIKSNQQKSVYLPAFYSFKDFPPESSTANMIILTSDPQKYSAMYDEHQYIKFHQDSISYQSDELETFFTVNYNRGLTYAQIFPKNKQMILMITHLSDHPLSLSNAISGMFDPYLTNSGNILLANEKHYYFFDLRDKISTDEKIGRSESFILFWDNYKLFIIVLVFAFILVLLSYIFKKSELAKTQIEDARK